MYPGLLWHAIANVQVAQAKTTTPLPFFSVSF